MKTFLTIAMLVSSALSSVTIGMADSDLDPGRITWWKNSWSSAPITTSSDHQGTISLTFYYKVTTAVTSGTLEISGSGIPIFTNTDVTLTAGQEAMATVPSDALSSATILGPFKIVTRKSQNGQIVDANYSFGSVYIAASFSENNALTVADTAATPVASPSHGASINLSFAFAIDYDMWEHDLIEIDIPLTDDVPSITPPASPVCKSLDTDTNASDTVVVNNLCTDITVASCDLLCEYEATVDADDATNSVYKIIIYGFNKSLNYISTAFDAKISIDNFTLPSMNYAGSEFSWTLRTKRFGTNYIYKEYAGTGPSTLSSIATSSITVSGTPHRGMANEKIFNGMVIYMDLVFTTTTAIPPAGTLEATLSGISAGNFNDDGNTSCVSSAGTCTASGTSVTITAGNEETIAAGSITATIYATFNLDAASATAQSKSGTRNIDATSASQTITMGATNSLTEDKATALTIVLGTSLTDDTEKNKGSDTIAFYIGIIPGEAVTTNNGLSMNCPFDNSNLSKTSIYISSTAASIEAKQLAIDNTSGPTTFADEDLAVDSGTAIGITFSSGALTVSSSDAIAVAANELYSFGVAEASSSGGVRAPMVTSNKLTYYECHGSIKSTDKFLNQVAHFSVTDNETIIAGNLLCLATDTTGIPLVVTITADTVDLTDTGYTITLDGGTYFGLGTGADSTATGWKSGGGSVNVSFTIDLMTVTGFVPVTTSTAVKIYLPQGDGNTAGDLIIFYTSGGVNHVISKKAAGVADGSNATTFTTTTPDIAFASGSSDDVGTNISINTGAYDDTTTDADILGISKIPPWWDITSVSYSTDSSGDTFGSANLGIISSTDPKFTGQTVFAIASSEGMGGGSNNVFSNIKVRSENEDNMMIYTAKVDDAGDGTSDCAGSVDAASTLDLIPATFSSVTMSPKTSAAKGPGVLAQTVTIGIPLGQPVPVGGTIEFDPTSFWEFPSGSECSVTGLTDKDEDNAVACDNTGSPYVISNFATTDGTETVTITLTNANPSSDTSVAANSACLGTITSKDAISPTANIIAQSTTPLSECSSTDPNAVGKSTFSSNAVVYYPNAGTRTADVHMTFSVNYALPSGSSIIITAPGTVTATKDTAFANFKYTDVSTSSSTVTFVTGEALSSGKSLEFYMDGAVVAGAAAATGNWKVATSYGGITYTDDNAANPVNAHTVTYLAAGEPITGGEITATVKTPGEYSSYKFTYTTPVAIEAADTIHVVFPMEFDPNIGAAEEFSSGDWRIQCSSTVLTAAVCKVDHWMVVVSSLTAVTVSSSVDLTIDFVKNPAAPGGAKAFGWIHMDDDGTTVNAIAETFASFTVETDPAFMELRTVAISNTQLVTSADYTLWLYVDTNIDASDEIRVMFPMQYDLPLYNGASLSCSATFADESVDPETTGDIDTSATTCTIYGNQAQWAASSTLAAAVDLDAHDRVIVSLTGVTNAAFGLSRTYVRPQYDLLSTAISGGLFTEYDVWSTKFEVSIYKPATNVVTYKSFANRNSAYVGFGDSTTERVSLQVGSYDAATMSNWLMVNAGQMSTGYAVTFNNDVPLIADQLNFTGTVTTLGLYIANMTSDWGFELLDDSLMLMVSAPAGTAAGVYYITFSVGPETQGSCQSTALYGPGPKVMVEVRNMTSTVSIATTATVYNTIDSYPIMVSLPYGPHTDVSVNINFGDNAGLINATSVVTFYRGEMTKYMTIQSSGLATADYDGTLSLTGTDAAAYTLSTSKLTASVKAATDVPTTIATITVSESGASSNSVSVGIAGGGDGIAYMSLKCSQTSSGFTRTRTIDEMKAKLTSVGMEAYDPAMTDMTYNTTSNTFYQFLKDVAAQACYTEQFASMGHLSASGSTFSFDWLMDAQRYLAIGYVEAYSVSTNGTAEFTTSDAKTLKRYTVLATSTQNITATAANSDTIACEIADNLRVSQHYLYRHDPTSVTNSADDSLTDSTYMFDLMYNRLDAANDPASFAAYLSDTAAVASDIKTALSLTATKDAVTLSVADVAAGTAPTVGTVLPEKTGETETTITFSWTPTNSGQWCSLCAAKTDDGEYMSKPDVNSIPYGLSAGYNMSPYMCMDVTASTTTTVVVSTLAEDTEYYCYHAFCSTDKLFPVCSEIVLSSNGPFTTDSASILAVFGLLVALIFN